MEKEYFLATKMTNNVNVIAWKPDDLLTQNLYMIVEKKKKKLCNLEETNKQANSS